MRLGQRSSWLRKASFKSWALLQPIFAGERSRVGSRIAKHPRCRERRLRLERCRLCCGSALSHRRAWNRSLRRRPYTDDRGDRRRRRDNTGWSFNVLYLPVYVSPAFVECGHRLADRNRALFHGCEGFHACIRPIAPRRTSLESHPHHSRTRQSRQRSALFYCAAGHVGPVFGAIFVAPSSSAAQRVGYSLTTPFLVPQCMTCGQVVFS
ncbi:anti-sigma factor RsiW [Bradyrhizobium sp. i1.8.4]